MNFFRLNYGLQPPFSVLLDPEFIQTSLLKKVFAKTALAELLGGPAVLVVTRCVTASLRAGGDPLAGAALMAKRLQHQECAHDHPIDPHECCYSLLLGQEERQKKLCLASQDPAFRKRARTIPGVPILHIYNTTVILDPPSTASAKHAQTKARSRRSLRPTEQALLSSADNPPREEQDNRKTIPHRILAQKRRAKGPNPLSVLKKGAQKGKSTTNTTSAQNTPLVADSTVSEQGGGADMQTKQHESISSNDNSNDNSSRKRKRKRKHGGKKANKNGTSDPEKQPDNPPGEGSHAKKKPRRAIIVQES